MSNTTTKTDETNENKNSWLDAVTFNTDGLVPAIAQDKDSGEILMMAWMNREALQLTAKTKTAVYFSRSRDKLWHKGETSGHTQIVHDLYLDCDADVIVLSVTQIGDIACHTGRRTCFYRRLDLSNDSPNWLTELPVLKNPKKIYGGDSITPDNFTLDNASLNNDSLDSASLNNTAIEGVRDLHHLATSEDMTAATILKQLDQVLIERKQADADTSYVASLYAKGLNKILEKVGEEAVETIIAAKDLAGHNSYAQSDETSVNIDDNSLKVNIKPNAETIELINDLIYETADVWFHTLVTLAWFNIGSDRVLTELARRFGLSGIDEKNSRPH